MHTYIHTYTNPFIMVHRGVNDQELYGQTKSQFEQIFLLCIRGNRGLATKGTIIHRDKPCIDTLRMIRMFAR